MHASFVRLVVLGLLGSTWAIGCSSSCDQEGSSATTVDAAREEPAPALEPAPVLDAAIEVSDAEPLDATPDAAERAMLSGPVDSRCRLAWGPARLPFRGPGVLRAGAGVLEVFFHDSGQPRVHKVAYGKPAAKPPKSVEPAGLSAMSFPACAVARDVSGASNAVYCRGEEGAIMRTRLSGGRAQVATAKVNHALAAAAFGAENGEHSVVAYLERRVVTGESTLEAYAVLDETQPVRLSDEGAGATFVTLISTGPTEMLALSIDARSAMSPVHARVLTLREGKLLLGEDVVIYVGASEPGGTAALARFEDGGLVALLPMPTDVSNFGTYGIALPMPPKLDLPAELFPYPKPITFPRVATARAGKKVYAALTRTEDASPNSLSVLEITEVQRNGSLLPLGLLASGVPMLDLDMIADEHDSLWVTYGDGSGSLLERRVCP